MPPESATRSGLSEAKRRLLEQRLRGRSRPADGIPRRPDPTAPAPLSFAQQRLWFLDRLYPGTAAYNLPKAIRVEGLLDVPLLERVLGEIVRRHEVLRTSLPVREGRPVQWVEPPGAVSIPRIDLRSLPPEPRRRTARHLARNAAEEPFDLERGPLWRIRLLVLGRDEHVILLTLHHVVSDGWSSGVLVRELAALYTAFAAGEPSPLPPLPIQYADFAAWEREWLQGERLERKTQWWRQTLDGVRMLELPTDLPRSPEVGLAGERLSFALSPELTSRLKDLAQGEGTTVFTVLLAAWKVLLARYTGQEDVCVGTPVAGRNRKEVEPLIGFFVNTLALRTRLVPAAPFRQALGLVRQTVLGAQDHQEIPFDRLVEELAPNRDLGHAPLFNVMFSFLPPVGETLELSGLRFEPQGVESRTAKFDLTLAMIERDGRFASSLEYRTELFTGDSVRRLAGHWTALLEALVADPDRAVADLPLMDATERRQLLGWGRPAVEVDGGEAELLDVPFVRQARRTPEAAAVLCGDRSLTYRELDRAADHLARRLVAAGVGPEVGVALCVERSPSLVVGLLGILRAGGVYVPLDPALPEERLAFLLADSGAAVVVAGEGLVGAWVADVARLEIAADGTGPGGGLPPVPAGRTAPQHLAYLIYTSGSTGRPKGVAVPHGAAAAHCRTVAAVYGLGEEDRVLQFASTSFDVSVEQILSTLGAGACLVLRGAEILAPLELSRCLAQRRVTVANLPTALWHRWVVDPQAMEAAPRSLRLVIAGGEEMRSAGLSAWERSPLARVRLLNGYGPTETVITATLHEAGGTGEGRIPIGRPLPGRSVRIVDRWGGEVPVGVVGELLLGGRLARGYLERRSLTAERFVPDPDHSGPGGGRLYRTGDRACWRPDGTLVFLGRVDHQVKVRGFRVEPGEIESALAAHPAVREAAVVLHPAGDRLVAYVAGAGNGEPPPALPELRGWLAERLPEHMVPSLFVLLESLPLTPTGKVDRRALPAPEGEVATAGDEGAEGIAGPVEEMLRGVWEEVLGLTRVPSSADFFALGGHSLMATRVVSRIRELFGVDLPLRRLFQKSRLDELAAEVESALGTAPAAPSIVPVPRQGPVPASFAQQRLWFLDRLEPGQSAYNVFTALALHGDLDRRALARSVAEIVRRHEVLRTTFRAVEGRPVQVIGSPDGSPPVCFVDLRGLPGERRRRLARRLRAMASSRPFDLERGPLFETLVLELGGGEHHLLVRMHHIVSDAWSRGLLVRELGLAYAAFAAGRPSPLEELALQYADYAHWQRRWLQGEVLEAQLDFWRDRLAGVPAALELPTDRPRPPVWDSRGGRQQVRLPKDLVDGLRSLARRQGVTSYMVLLAAFQVLLHRLTGQDDLTVGSPIAGRNRREVETLIGFFVNTLVLRSRIEGDPSFDRVLASVRETALAAYEHQDLPFERLVEELVPERSLGRTPLFQVAFALQTTGGDRLSLPSLELRPLGVESRTAKFDLTLVLAEGEGEIAGWMEYPVALFDASTVGRLLGHWRTLLSGVVESPETRMSELPLLSPAERNQLLVEWTGTATGYPREATIDALFAVQAKATPEAVAVEMAEAVPPARTSLTYRQLDEASTALAIRLRAAGVGPEVRVGLCVERSLALPVALLAVLKAGGAFVPLDPDYPQERLALMMEDAGLSVLLAQEPLAAALPPHDLPLVPVDADGIARLDGGLDTTGDPGTPPCPGTVADSLAYIMYTSGSTGRPNGVSAVHRGVVRLVREADYADLGPEESFCQVAPISFDASTLEIWGRLLNGGRLVIAPPGPPSLEGLGRIIARHRVSTLWATTGLFHQMVEEKVENLRGLRQLLTGGEVLSTSLARRFLETVPGCRLYNAYGPTENTTFTTCHPLDRPEDVGRVASIGRPIADTTVYVVGRRLELVPVGVVGELWTGGDGLARGYWDRPAKTAERFVPHPWSVEPGARLYRSGDLVRWRRDGTLDFVGRRDFQYKIRGFRVELGEVEIALGSLPRVAEAVAVVREEPTGKRLLGYVTLEPAAEGTPEPGADVAGAALREVLAERLPPHLVPSVVIVLDELPLSPTGKVDRRALPDPRAARQERSRQEPRTAAERTVAAIWTELLATGPLSVDDDFFALGGHSLLATRVVARVADALGTEVPLRTLFENPTLEQFAARVETPVLAGPAVPAPPLVPVARDGRLALSFAQLRFWFLHRLDPDSAAYNIPGALRFEGPLRAGVLQRTLEGMLHRHEILRTTYEPGEGEPQQVVAAPGPFVLPRIDLSGLPVDRREGTMRRLVAEDAKRPFDLRRGPVLRLALLRLAAEHHVLITSVHHVAADGWSLGIFLREVGRLYGALLAGRSSPLPPLPIQYADYAAWQRNWLRGEVLAQRLAWWRERLAGAPSALELPTDRPRPSALSLRGGHLRVALDPGLTAELVELGRRHGATLFMTLLASFQVLLGRWSGQDDVSVGVPVAGRTRTETDGVLGCFVNTLVLRNRLPPEDRFEELLERVREGALGAQQHQDVPFEKLVEELHPERHLDRSPLFQVLFALQNFPRPERKPAPELRLSGLGADSGTEKFDLSLSLAEVDDRVRGTLQYSVDLFDAATMARMVRHWTTLLAGIVEAPASRLRELPLLSVAERHQVTREWSDTVRGGVGPSVVERVLGQAERHPGAVAVVDGDGSRLTYGELVARARGLAEELVGLGVGPESVVGILLPRSASLLVSHLAAMLAGGAYVPLDPAHPPARLLGMLSDASAAALVSTPDLVDRLEEGRGEVGVPLPPVVDPGAVRASAEAAVPILPDPEQLAYVLFTSGSTGRPKGVAMSHGALANLLDWSASVLGFGEDTRASQVAGLGFDASVWEIWSTLVHGGSLHLLPSMETLAPREMAAWLRRERLTHCYLPTPVAEALLRSGEAADLPDLVLLSAGGDRLQRAPDEPLGFDFVNLYGPAEACVNSTAAVVPQDGSPRPPIGRPVHNTGIRVLDRTLGPVPVGVTGDLYVVGAGVGRGYAGRTGLTASRFVPDPLGEEGGRAYRTGDLVRWLPDGQLDFLGRVDHQVQLRGLRVELGEIEALLAADPTVSEAVVLADGPVGAVERLVAYVVAAAEDGDPAALTDALRSSLHRRLPDYMVPTVWMVLDELPLTPNGKIDRRALPRPEALDGSRDRRIVAPRTPAEQAVAAIWTEVLGTGGLGVDDDFFALGGHSLLATQVVSRTGAAFGIEVPLRALFENPTVEGFAAALEGLEGREDDPIERGDGGPAPLSFAQQRLWFLDRLEPGGSAYNVPVAVRLRGALDPPVLRRALQEVVRRHEVLRTRFRDGRAGDGPVQEPCPPLPLPLPVLDLSAVAGDRREALARRLARDEGRRPFDLGRAPLLRPRLLRLGETEHVLLVTMHHVVTDGWSMSILTRELTVLYAALGAGEPSPLPELPIQYADFARWQRRRLSGEVLEAEVARWRERLAGTPMLELPTDRPRPRVLDTHGAARTFSLGEPLSRALLALAGERGVTPFVLLMAAFQVLLHRHAGQDDLAVGTPVAGRQRAEVEDLIGFFVNTLVLRGRLEGNPTFVNLLDATRERALDAFAQQELPFERLVEALEPERRMDRTPVFQVMFAFQNAPRERLVLGDVELDPFQVEGTTAKFDLTLSMGEGQRGLGGALEYRTGLFDASTVERMLGHWRTLLAGIVESPAARLSELPLLAAAERNQLLVEWTATATDYPREATIDGLFAEQVAATPDAVAVEMAGAKPPALTALTYRQLDSASTALAVRLRSTGVGPEVRVGLCVERSLALPVALLAVLKAGGAFVPLDPDYPQERLALMVEDAGLSVLLAQEPLAAALPSHDLPRVLVDGRGEILGGDHAAAVEAGSLPAPETGPSSLAYIMYTSGSTGRPNGVAVPHRGVVRLVREADYADLGPEQSFLQLAPISFDASTLEVWGPLLNGGRLVVVPPGPPSLADLDRVITEHRVTSLWLTAGLFHQLVEERVESLRGVRQLLAGGDVLSATRVRRFLEAVPGARLINGYGPTENTTFTTCHPMDRPAQVGRTVPIGRSIADTTVYVVGRRLELVPVGVVGELWTGGDGLARGYWDRPAKTAERFVPHPWSVEPGARLYRTGDLVRWRPDGTLDFIGRRDFQFKIRGFRVELGEVEIALGSLPGVAEAVAVVRDGVAGKRLLGYVSLEPDGGGEPAAGGARTGAALREALAELLPPHLVPSVVVVLDELPLSPTGKVDRRILPDPEEMREERMLVAPRTAVERAVADIWTELLGTGSLGTGDDFFALGGHSLLATRVVSRVAHGLGTEVPLRTLFEHPTLEGFAARVEALALAGTSTPPPPVVPVARDGALPLSFAQRRFWFLHRLDPASAAYNVPGAVRLEGPLEAGVLQRALEAMVHRHEILRTTYEPGDPEGEARGNGAGEPRQVIAPPKPFPLPRIDLSSLPGERRERAMRRLVAEDARRPFDLRRGPVLRVALLRLAAQDHVLVASTHHVASDGWSRGIFLREVGQLYGAFAAGRRSPLAPLPVQYADYAAWQRGWLRGEVLEERVAWWRSQLAGASSALELPTDRPRPPALSLRGRGRAVSVDPALTGKLADLGRSHGATLFMTLLAAFQVLLSRWSGQEDVSVGVPVAGRSRHEVEGVLGCFVNTLVLRNTLPPESTFEHFLARVREGALGAQQHQDVPFEKLVEELHPKRNLDRSPLFQVSFALQNFPRPERRPAPKLRLSGLGADSGTEKFDLSFTLSEVEDRVEGTLQYSVDLFDDTTMQRMVRHWDGLLAGIVADPTSRLRDLPLLSVAERHQVTREWSDTVRGGVGPSVVEWVLRQAERRPDAVAVVDGDGSRLTYGELVARARGLAGELVGLGVGPESVVGILLPRSASLLVSHLAAMLAGGAYVPLDPAHPPARLLGMLSDVSAAALVSTPDLVGRLEEGRGEVGVPLPPVVDPRVVRASQEMAAPVPPDPDRLAYVLFTSGSTGRPKGVAMSHGALANLLDWTASVLGFDESTRASQVAGLGFDASVREIWSTLAHGGSLHLLPSMETLAPREMAAWLRRERLTHCYLPMPVAEALLRSGEAADLPDLVLLGAGGDRLQRAPEGPLGFDFVNLYGPAETCVNSTAAVVPQDGSPQPPIGRPVHNTRIRVLDRALGPVPVGVTGELYLAGAGVARGYAGRPGLTASRFVPDPLGQEGGRAYRTGDLVRWLPDGQLDFLGRVDHQVQLRGLRVELGEIEALLVADPAVSKAVVLPDGPVGAVERLVAYVVAAAVDGDPAALTDTLRSSLRRRLPDYMVPTAWMVLDELPLTPNGKIDRRALPRPEALEDARERRIVAPRTPAEQAVAGIWGEILGTGGLGVDDDFFALGGHSLLATQVVSRTGAAFGTEVPLRALFEHPTLGAFAARVEALAASGPASTAPPLVPVARDGELPLSFAQRRFWFLHRLDPASAAYNVPGAVRLEGSLEVGLLRRAVEAMVHRHEILRTTYEPGEPEPRQVVAPPGPFPLPRVDLSALPAERRERALRRLLTQDAKRPFDLRRGPVLRVALLRLAAEDHVLLASTHHVASDGWSRGIFLRELGRLYGAFAAGRRSPLPPLPIQYADYAAWQRGWLRGDALEERIAWWRTHLAGAPPALELPTDRPRPSIFSQRGRGQALALDPGLTAELVELGRRHGATLFMTLLASFQLLLSRWSGQDDVSVGVPVAGRTRAETEGVLGCFVNTLVLRNRLPPEDRFEELLARVREGALGAQQHQDVPFEKLVEELHPERHLDRSPLFQVLFALQNFPRPERQPAPELRLSGLGADSGTEKFDLSLVLAEVDDRVRGTLQYSVDLFDAATMVRMVRHWTTLLAGIVEAPDSRLRELPLLSAAERHQVTREWSGEVRRVGPSVVERVLGHVERRPGTVAVMGEEEELSYDTLLSRADRLARELCAAGAGPESVVGIYMRRSPAMVASLLAVLRAGAAYLPLDPAHPPQRLADALLDAGAVAVVADPDLAAALQGAVEWGAAGPPRMLDPGVQRPEVATAEPPCTALVAAPHPESLAYVLFTSGSTGRPKGVGVSHGALANLLDWTASVGFRPDSRTAQVAGLGFDASVWEIWSTLATGGRLHLLPSVETLAPAQLAAWIRRRRLTEVFLPTPVAEALLRSGEASSLESLTAIFTGGDRLQRGPAEPLPFSLVNMYGPTEACVNVTAGVVPPDGSPRPSIGSAIPNSGLRVLGRDLRPVAVGVAGELWIGGAGVGRGYVGRPALTASRFVPDPLGEEGGRAYRTGDLVRWLPDGHLDFLGRVDHQVQLRGLRVELGEIEALLVADPAVSEAVVLPDGPVGAVERLVAYVVAAAEDEVPAALTDALRSSLHRRLPDYMVPTVWMVLDELPLTPNGKIDRRALPAVRGGAPEGPRRGPRDAVELVLVQVFEDLLGVPVGVEEDFFALGGHSLLAVQLVARVEQRLGRSLPLAALFADPTVERLAVRLRQQAAVAGREERQVLVPLRRGGEGPPFFCVHPVGGNVFCYLDLVRHLEPEHAVYALQMPTGEEIPGDGLEAMAEHYLEEVRRAQPDGPYRLGGWSFGGILAFEMARQLSAAGQDVELLAVLDGQLPSEGAALPEPLERLRLFGRDLAGLGGLRLAVDPAELRKAEAEGRLDSALDQVLDRASREGLLPPDLPADSLRHLYHLFEGNLDRLHRYRPTAYAGTVTLFLADESPASQERAERWATVADRLEIVTVPGDHYSILREPQVEELARRLRPLLQEEDGSGSDEPGGDPRC